MGRVFFNTRKNVHALDGAYTVLASDSGKIFMLSATGGTVAITLPTTLEKGLHYKFVTLEDTPSNAITLGAATTIIDFVMKDAGGNASNSSAGTQKTNIIVGATATKGDYINLLCDGSSYYAEGLSAIDDAFTTS